MANVTRAGHEQALAGRAAEVVGTSVRRPLPIPGPSFTANPDLADHVLDDSKDLSGYGKREVSKKPEATSREEM